MYLIFSCSKNQEWVGTFHHNTATRSCIIYSPTFGPQNRKRTLFTLPVHLSPAWCALQPPFARVSSLPIYQMLTSSSFSSNFLTYHLGGTPAPVPEWYIRDIYWTPTYAFKCTYIYWWFIFIVFKFIYKILYYMEILL